MSDEFAVTHEMVEVSRKVVQSQKTVKVMEVYNGGFRTADLIEQLEQFEKEGARLVYTHYNRHDDSLSIQGYITRQETDDEVVKRLHNEHHRRLVKQQEEIALLKSLQEKYKDKEL